MDDTTAYDAPGTLTNDFVDEVPTTGHDATRNNADYQVIIKISAADVNDLKDYGFRLYGFRAVQAQTKASPLVWFRTATFSTSTTVKWKRTFYAYTSTSELIPNGHVEASFEADITFNQTLVVNKPGNTGDVVHEGTPNAIRISNKLEAAFVGGIAERVGEGEYRPLCASKVFGGHIQAIAPIEKVLFMFIQDQIETGTVITRAISPGVLIDLTAASQRQVTYDLNKGWSWQNNESWARRIEANADLAPLLIDTPASFLKGKNYYSEIG